MEGIKKNSSIFLLLLLIAIDVIACRKPDISNAEESINFFVIGDWGGIPITPYTTTIEKAIAHEMGHFAQDHDVQFILALGDNFYFDGVKNVEDPRFQETYDVIFSEKSLYIDWYLIAGNHDHNGNVTAQIEYSLWEKRWNFPNYYYSLQFTLPVSKVKVDIVMIDTVQLCGNSDHDFIQQQPQGPASTKDAEVQWKWIEQQLTSSKADYLLVAGHYPVLSISSHGPTKCLVNRLQPLLHKHSVSAYLCGHDHNLQHLEYTSDNSTVEYFLSGAANFIDTSRKHKGDVPTNSSKFFWADDASFGGYGFVEITASKMMFSFNDASGKLLYSKTLPPRSNSHS